MMMAGLRATVPLLAALALLGSSLTAPRLHAAGFGSLAEPLRACARDIREDAPADAFGLVRVRLDERCPALWVALGAEVAETGGRARLFPSSPTTTVREVEDFARIAEGARGPSASGRLLPAARLQEVLAALDPAARGELSTRARLARWWRSVVGEFDPVERERRRSGPRVQWPLAFWSTGSWFAVGAAVLLIFTVVFQEVRAALGPRAARRSRSRRERSTVEQVVDRAALAALPPRQRAGELLRAVAARLHGRDALPPPTPLTPREIERLARLPESRRAPLARVAGSAEQGAYGRQPPDDAEFEEALDAASPWLGVVRGRWTRGGRA